jgi:hypothetical protein
LSVNWGDVPTWLATAGASIAAVFAYRALRIEQRRDAGRDDEARRKQAEGISAWVGPREGGSYDSPEHFEVVVGNTSDQPAYGLFFTAFFDDGGECPLMNYLNVLPPQSRVYLDRELADDDADRAADPFDWKDATISVRFFDARGQQWLRNEIGSLSEYTPPEPTVGS